MPTQFLVRIEQMLGLQIVAHVQVIHGKHLAQVYIMVCWDVEYIALNGIHEMLIQPENHEMIEVRQRDEA